MYPLEDKPSDCYVEHNIQSLGLARDAFATRLLLKLQQPHDKKAIPITEAAMKFLSHTRPCVKARDTSMSGCQSHYARTHESEKFDRPFVQYCAEILSS